MKNNQTDKSNPQKKKEAPDKQLARPGDHVFFQHPEKGPMSGHVVCCGKHGATVKCDTGEHHKVHWGRILGHKQRGERAAKIIDQGEDGSICEDQNGERFFLRGNMPDQDGDESNDEDQSQNDDDGDDMKKSMLLFPKGKTSLSKAIANQAGLQLRETTDKMGHQTKRWMKTNPDQNQGKQPGAGKQEDADQQKQPGQDNQDPHQEARQKVVGNVVQFSAGSFQGKGEVTAAGKDGVTVKDDTGREHQVHWHELHAGDKDQASNGQDAGAADAGESNGGDNGEQKKFGIDQPLFDDKEVASLPVKAKQPVSDPDELWKKSAEAMTDYTSFLTGISETLGIKKMTQSPDDVDFSQAGGMLFIAPLKGQERAKEKVENKYGGDWSRLCDVVRASIAVDTLDDLKGLMAKLKDGGMELAAKPDDRFHKPTAVGYADVNLNVKLSNGLVGELQLHVKPMLEAKNAGHKPYEVIRKVEERAPEAEWSDEDKKAHQNAVMESKSIYGKAWDRLKGGSDSNNDQPIMTKSHSSDRIILLFRRV